MLVVVALLASGCARATGDAPAPGAAGEVPAGSGWQRLPDPPLSGRTHPAAVVVDGRLHVFGGWTALCPPGADCTLPEGPAFRDGAVLDVESSRWKPMADAPYGLRGVSTAVLGADVYVASTCHDDTYCQGPYSLLRYDTVTDRWEERAPLPRSLRYLSLSVVGDRLLALSTSDESGERPDAVYDPATDTWEELPDDPLPEGHDRFAVVDGDRLLVFESIGVDDGERRKAVAALDLRTRVWTILPDAPGPGYQAWRSGDEVWLNPHYGPGGGVLDLETDTWQPFPDGPRGVRVRPGRDHRRRKRDLRVRRRVGARHRPRPMGAGAGPAGPDVRRHRHRPRRRAGRRRRPARWQGDDGELVAETWLWRPGT